MRILFFTIRPLVRVKLLFFLSFFLSPFPPISLMPGYSVVGNGGKVQVCCVCVYACMYSSTSLDKAISLSSLLYCHCLPVSFAYHVVVSYSSRFKSLWINHQTLTLGPYKFMCRSDPMDSESSRDFWLQLVSLYFLTLARMSAGSLLLK